MTLKIVKNQDEYDAEVEKLKKQEEEKLAIEKLIAGSKEYKYYKYFNTSGVDDKYISSFSSEVSRFFEDYQSDKLSYDDAQALLSGFNTRYNTIQAWLYQNKDKLKEDSYKNLLNSLGSVKTGLDAVKGHYSQWGSEDEYQDYIGKRDFDLDAGLKEIEGLQSTISEYNALQAEKKEILQSIYDEMTIYERGQMFGSEYTREEVDNGAYLDNPKLQELAYKTNSRYQEIEEQMFRNSWSKYRDFSLEDAQNELNSKTQYYNVAKAFQEELALLNPERGEDFDYYVQMGREVSNPEFDDALPPIFVGGLFTMGQGEEINNMVTFAEENMLEIDPRISVPGPGRELDATMGLIEKYMTDDEKAIYNYYVGKGDTENAKKYYNYIIDVLRQRKASEIVGWVDDTGWELIFSAAAGIEQFFAGVGNLDNYMMGTEADYTTSMQYAYGITSSNNTGLWKVSNDLINTTAHMLPTILVSTVAEVALPSVGEGVALGSALGSVTLGASATGNAYAEMRNLGYDANQARLYATLVGASEAGLQYLMGGIGKLGGVAPNGLTELVLSKVDNAFARVAIQLGSSMLSEGLEEGIQTVLEPWFKSIVTGVDFEAPGIDEILYSSLLGALSAGFLDGIEIGGSTLGTTIQGNRLMKNGVTAKSLAEYVINNESLFSADTVAYQIVGRVNENTGAYTVARLFNEVNAFLSEQNKNDIINALEAHGIDSKNAKTIAEAMALAVAGAKLTPQQQAALDNNPIISRVTIDTLVNAHTTVNQRMQGFKEAMFGEKIAKEYFESKSVESTIADLTSEAETTAEQANVSDSGKTLYNGNEVSVNRIVSTDGGIKVELDSEETVSASDLSFASKEEALMYEMVARMETTPETANEILKTFKPSDVKQASAFYSSIPLAYTYGKMNYEAGLKNVASALSKAQKKLIYNRGRADAITSVKSKTDSKKSGASKTKNGIIYEKGVSYDESSATEIQKVSMAYIEVIDKMSNLEIHVFESKIKNGKRVATVNGKEISAPNGYYKNGNQIYIDINAGNKAEGVMLITMAHEITHYIREWNAEGFKELADFLIAEYGKQGVPVNYLLEAQKEKIRKQYEEEGTALPGDAKLTDMAYEEMVADAMGAMLTDPKAYEKLAKLKQKNQTLWQKVGEAIKAILDKFKTALGIYKGRTQTNEADFVSKFAPEVYEKLQDLYLKAFVEADANYEASIGSEASESKVSTSAIRGSADGAVVKTEVVEAIVSSGADKTVFSTKTEYEPLPKQTMSLSTGAGTILDKIEGLKPTKIKGVSSKSINGYTGRDVRAFAMKASGFTVSQIDKVNEFMDAMADFMEKAGVTYRFIGLNDVKNAKLHYSYNPDGSIKSIVLSAMVKNGDYPVNFDLSSICKKRDAMSKLIRKLAERGAIDNGTVSLTPTNIFKINTALKDAGYETACLGCFVESKRYNSLQWATTFCNKWNAAVKKINPNASYFGYGNATFTEDSFTVDQAIKIDEAANKYNQTAKVERMANALAKYKAKEAAGEPLVAGKVMKVDGEDLNTFSKAARDRLAKSDTISDELKTKYLTCDVSTLTMADVEFLLENGILPGANLSNKQAVTELVKSGEAYQHLLRPSDLLTDSGISKLEALPNFHGVLYGHYGSGTPKLMQSYTPYNSEIALLPSQKNSEQSLAEYLYSIAGVRMQSFSDFQIQNIYDYLQMVADLTARKAPAHAYTKEISFAKLLGMTGIKINLSVMFDIDPMVDKAHAGLTKMNPLIHKGEYAKIVLEDAQGKWVYNIGDYQTQKLFAEAFPDEDKRFLQSIGFADAVKLQTSEGYSANCGIIGVGYSDLGIFAMLDDNRIRYIIPYHASSLPSEIKVATLIERAVDYTPYQNNMKIVDIVDSNGNKVNWTIKEAYKRLGSGQAVLNELNDKIRNEGWVVNTKKAQTGHGTYGMYENLQETNDPRQTVGNFIDWCIGNNTLPLFYQFASHSNYYKLLFDFNVFDCVTEEYAPQQAVTNTYPTMVDGRVQAGNVTDGDFNTEYFQSTIDKQMAFMDAYSKGLDADLEKLADNMEKGNYSLKDKAKSPATAKKIADTKYSTRVLMGSLFSGGGTLEAGLVYQMLDKEFAVEYNKKIAATYTDNHGKEHMFVGDVRDFNSKDKQNVFYLHASPVCKNFSPASHKGGETTLDITTAQATIRVLEEQMPQVFTVENVKRYIDSEAYNIITNKLDELGYTWDVAVYKASDYGNATKRERMIIRAVKDGQLPAKPQKVSNITSWGEATRDLWKTDLIPSNLVKSKIEAIKNTPKLKNLSLTKLDKPLMIYDTTKSKQAIYAWADELAPTLTTKCGDARIIMPDGRVYAPTPKFMGRIQGLPDNYKYPTAKTNAFKIIGNGIPTQLTKSVIGGVLDSAYEQTHDGKVLYSTRDTSYLDAVNREDMATAQRMVDEAAKKAGYDSPKLYHGTNKFGFTEFDTNRGHGFIYASTKSAVAANYGGRDNYAFTRKVGRRYISPDSVEYWNDPTSAMIQNAKTVLGSTYKVMDNSTRQTIREDVRKAAEDIANKIDELYVNLNLTEELDTDLSWVTDLFYSIKENDGEYFSDDADTKEWWLSSLQDAINHYNHSYPNLRGYLVEHLQDLDADGKKFARFLMSYDLSDTAIDIEYRYNRVANRTNEIQFINDKTNQNIVTTEQLQGIIDKVKNIGVYELYGNVGSNPLVVDAENHDWVCIKVPQMGDDRYHSTDVIAEWAKQEGYSSVIVKNVYDGGENADDYIFFDSNQVKSADPVTYDDKGNVIPLSERFNAENNDIRYSTRDTNGNLLSKEQQEFFKDSKVRDADGNLMVMYHGTTKGGFTVFDASYSDDGRSLFFTSSKKTARSYGISGKVFGDTDFEKRSPINTVEDAKAYFNSVMWKVIELHDGKGLDGKTEVSHWRKNVKYLLRNHQGFPQGAFFSDQELIDYAERQAQDADKRKLKAGVYEVYLNIQNPLVVDAEGKRWNQIDFLGKTLNTRDISKYAQENGYDGVIFKNINDAGQYDIFGDTGIADHIAIAFNSEQVKATTNKNPTSDPDIRYSLRDDNSVSNRSLLANALESVAQNDIEKNKLNQYKEKIALIESAQAKLSEIKEKANELRFTKGRSATETKQMRDLEAEATRIANRINTYDKQLLDLESTTALKGVLAREKAMLRKRLEQKGKEALKAQKQKDAETIRTLMQKHTESRAKAIEGRHKTELRHKIKNVVADLNKLLLNPTKEQHVPIGLQLVVSEALDAINMDTMNAGERVAYYNDLIAKSTDPDERAMLTRKRDFFEYRDANFKERITALKNAYADIKNDPDPLVQNAHHQDIEDLIENTADAVGTTSLKDMSYAQLEAVHNMYTAILATVRKANQTFFDNIKETIAENGEAVKSEVKEVGGHKDRVLKGLKFIKKFGWGMLKPVTAMKFIGSKTFEKLFGNVRAGEDTWATDVNEAKAFYNEISKKYGYKKWDFKKRYTFKDSAGQDISLSLEQIMSLYAYSKRDQADKHLDVGGFVFDDAIEVVEKKFGIPLKYEVNDANPYRLKKQDLFPIIASLTEEQKGFVDEMQTYLSEVMGAKGNEVSLAMYDIKLYNEKNYFPLKTARYFREFDPEKGGTPKIKNSGFSKKTMPHAGNPIILSNFMDVWASHVNDMSMYHAFVLPLEDFMRVFNYKTTAGGYDSVQQYIKNAYGSEANQYIQRLMDDLNGGARVDSAADVINKGLALFKKASVFASASVVIQQPSAIARAFAYINPKYFVTSAGSALNLVKHKAVWEEIKKYAPVAVIKEMGYFDTGMGKSTVEWIKGNKTFKDKVDDALAKAPAMADELTWSYIWLAVKNEIKATTNLTVGSDEFLTKCAERFTEIITNTQVYDSVLSRSGMMRSKDTGSKMVTAFMAEPTTTVNMMVDGIMQGKRGNIKFTASTIGAVSTSIILNSLLVSLVYAARDDDEDETYLEKYAQALTTELIDGFNPLTYIPIVKDAWSILQGFDVERADMTLITNLFDSLQQVVKVLSKDTSDMDEDELDEYQKDVREALLSIVDNATSLFGVPIKNIRRDFNAIINTFKTISGGDKTTAGSLKDAIGGAMQNSIPVWGWFPDESKSDKLYDAIVSGDEAYVKRIEQSYKDTTAYESAVKKALRENDSRIKEAAQAELNGNVSERVRIAKEIVAEGNFELDIVIAAINAEINALKKGESSAKEPTEDKEEAISYYNASDIHSAFENGDTYLAKEIISDLIATKVANGMTEKEAKSSLRSSMTSYWKPLYKQAYQSGDTSEMARIRQILFASGLYGTANDVINTAKSWLKD